MNNKLLLFSFILFSTQTTHSMIRSYDKSNKKFNQNMRCNDVHAKKSLSINLHELAQTNMTILGALPFVKARKKAYQLIHPHNYLSDDQELFLNILALPFELSLPILFGKKYKNNQATIGVFCSQPVGKALELYSMLAEKYAKDEKLARLISFNELYANHTSYIELYDAIKYFSHNQEGVYERNYQQIKMLILLSDNVKNSYDINNKKFLLTSSYKELLCKRLEKTVHVFLGLDAYCVFLGRHYLSVGTNVMLGSCLYWFGLCCHIKELSEIISNMKPLTLSNFQKLSALEKYVR